MRVLITGATGFVGSYIARHFVANGDEVAIIRRTTSQLHRLEAINGQIQHIVGSLDDVTAIEPEIIAFQPEIVVHAAWQDVAGAHRNALVHYERNLPATLAFVQTILKTTCRVFIGIGSQGEYGNLNRMISEDMLPQPTTMYGTAKLCAYLVAKQQFSQSDVRFVWVRLFSSYGPGDNPHWLIPYLTRTLLEGECPALTRGEQLWDFIYIDDVARGVLALAQHPHAQGVFNLGSGQAVALREVIEGLRDMIDPLLPLGFGQLPYRADQIMHLQADMQKLQTLTGWQPQVSLNEGLAKTIASIRAEIITPGDEG